MHRLEIDLSDSTRSVWEHLELRLARHPSESDGFFGARILAYALSWAPDLVMGEDLSTPDAPALELRTPTLAIAHWIDIGVPSAKRLNLATRSAERVSVFCHRDPANWLRELSRDRVQAPDRVEVTLLDFRFAEAMGAALGRRGRWSLMRDEEMVQVVTETETHDGILRSATLESLLAG